MTKIAIFASGSGTNAENIINYFDSSDDIKVALVLSNREDAKVHERAKKLGVPSFAFTNAEFREGTNILATLATYEIGFIALAGFMALISPALLQAYDHKIINIHPSLLPKYGGKGMFGRHVHEAVLAAGEHESGITIHYVNERYDEGEIIFQALTPISPNDNVKTLEHKIHNLEYNYYPLIIKKLVSQ
ncbi:MAG: phosphoribosylglycinamide formyltransferase [Tannerella sp.]|jgi:phosphoribosylglycinamide formyltransferase-1|nr:phosphoribosylglycinamide formyltransferase [Tannerella sp.]